LRVVVEVLYGQIATILETAQVMAAQVAVAEVPSQADLALLVLQPVQAEVLH
jgi:hypothetical protein